MLGPSTAGGVAPSGPTRSGHAVGGELEGEKSQKPLKSGAIDHGVVLHLASMYQLKYDMGQRIPFELRSFTGHALDGDLPFVVGCVGSHLVAGAIDREEPNALPWCAVRCAS